MYLGNACIIVAANLLCYSLEGFLHSFVEHEYIFLEESTRSGSISKICSVIKSWNVLLVCTYRDDHKIVCPHTFLSTNEQQQGFQGSECSGVITGGNGHAAHRSEQRRCVILEDEWTYGLVLSQDLPMLDVPPSH